MTNASGPRAAPVLGLIVPVEAKEPVSVALVAASSAAFSDAIGGGLLDDAMVGVCEGGRFGVYLNLERQARQLPPNDRAAVLLARLGKVDRPLLAGLRDDALVVGMDARGGDCDLPAGVLVAACQAGQRVTVTTDLDQGLQTAYLP